MEKAMFQMRCHHDDRPENYITKGLDEKLNYFANQFQIFDLEYNIPL